MATEKEIAYHQYSCENQKCLHVWNQNGTVDCEDENGDIMKCPKCGGEKIIYIINCCSD